MPKTSLSSYIDVENGLFSKKRSTLIQDFGSSIEALLYAELFSPEFVEVEGSIILKDNISDAVGRFRVAKAKQNMPLDELEASFNLVEIGHLFSPTSVSSDAIEFALAQVMAASWQGRLKLLYPDRIFCVSVLTPAETGSVVGLEFYEIR